MAPVMERAPGNPTDGHTITAAPLTPFETTLCIRQSKSESRNEEIELPECQLHAKGTHQSKVESVESPPTTKFQCQVSAPAELGIGQQDKSPPAAGLIAITECPQSTMAGIVELTDERRKRALLLGTKQKPRRLLLPTLNAQPGTEQERECSTTGAHGSITHIQQPFNGSAQGSEPHTHP